MSLVRPKISGCQGTNRNPVTGVKMTGGLDVPFNITSFEVVDERPLIIPEWAQEGYGALYEYSKAPQFGDINVRTSKTRFYKLPAARFIYTRFKNSEIFETIFYNF